jgi:hypothetical protein
VPALLRKIGVKVIRFPGGSTSDVYHWQHNRTIPGDSTGVDPANTFDRVMSTVARPAGAEVMVTVNYGSNGDGTGGGDPQEAAAWVRHANSVKKFGVRYWEIGNEIYGNGFYGAKWETDLHADRSPAAYAHNALDFIHAMKAADPSIHIGLVLAAPGQWPDGQPPQNWNQTVLGAACQEADFVSIHWYPQQPGQESDAGLLRSADTVPGMVKSLQDLFAQQCGDHRPKIMVTEMNSVSSNPGKQTTSPVNALFLVESYAAWLQAGVANVTWWDLHNSSELRNNNSRSLAGTKTYGDYGVLSSGQVPEPAANTPFPTYWGLRLLTRAGVTPGAHFLPVRAAPPGQAYALRRPDRSIAVILINRSRSTTRTVHVSLAGAHLTPRSVTSLSLASPRLRTVSLHGPTYSLEPYAAAVLVFR